MSFSHALHPLCCQIAGRDIPHAGPGQWAGLHLSRDPDSDAFSPARTSSYWRRAPVSRVLVAVLFGSALAHHTRSRAHAAQDPLHRTVVLRDGKPFRRFADLAHDLATQSLEPHALIGVAPYASAPAIQARHIRAVERRLAKAEQRRNISRLLSHSSRLSLLTESPDALDTLSALDAKLAERFGETGHPRGDLLSWTLLGRLEPFRFVRRLGRTDCKVGSLYMDGRQLEQRYQLDPERGRMVRAALLFAIRRMNQVMGWRNVGEGFPERLAMTQSDLKRARQRDSMPPDDPKSQGGLQSLASRNHSAPGDEQLWERIIDDPNAHHAYLAQRHTAELDAEHPFLEQDMSALSQPVPTLLDRPWFPIIVLAVCALLAVVTYLAIASGSGVNDADSLHIEADGITGGAPSGSPPSRADSQPTPIPEDSPSTADERMPSQPAGDPVIDVPRLDKVEASVAFGSIDIITEPKGMNVRVVGQKLVTRSPLRLEELEVDSELELRIQDPNEYFADKRVRIKIEPGENEVRVRMKRLKTTDSVVGNVPDTEHGDVYDLVDETAALNGKVAIQAVPWGHVYVDGKRMGTTPQMLSLTPGKHRVEIMSSDESKKVEREIEVEFSGSMRLIYDFPEERWR